MNEEGVDDFITVYGGGAGPDATTWDDVVGAPAAVSELRRILRVAGAADASQKARRAGATPPSNVLLAGPPGTGKTLIARAAAAQLDAPLLVASAAEIVKGKYAGVGVERVRTLFAAARRVAARVPEDSPWFSSMSSTLVEESEAATRRRSAPTTTTR